MFMTAVHSYVFLLLRDPFAPGYPLELNLRVLTLLLVMSSFPLQIEVIKQGYLLQQGSFQVSPLK